MSSYVTLFILLKIQNLKECVTLCVTNLQPYVKKNEESFKQKKENLLEEEEIIEANIKKKSSLCAI